jgi:hypothetical protein
MRSNRVYCDKCEDGIITTKDPNDPPGVYTFTVCEDCDGKGWYEYLKGFIVLLVPNFLLFWS